MDKRMKPLNRTMPIAEAAYLAGLIDGEGSISVSRTSTSASAKGCRTGFAYRAGLSIVNTNMKLLDWCVWATGIGGIAPKTRERPNHKPSHAWSVWSKDAADVLQQVLPYLIAKAPQARLLIEFQQAMRMGGPITDDEWRFRETCRLKSMRLNARGMKYVQAIPLPLP